MEPFGGARPVVLSVLAGALAGFSSGAPVHAQAQEEQRPPELILPTSVEVVRLDVVVTEKRGRPKAGLRREDFAVFEDGQPQPIVQFQAFTRPAAATPVQAATPAKVAVPEEEPENLLPARYVVLVIDDVHMEFETLSRARKALSRFLREDLRPEDQVALVTTSGASALSQEFTADRAVLQQILNRLSPQGRRTDWTSVPRLSDYQAELIEQGDPLALEAAVEEIMQSGVFQDPETSAEEARRRARGVLAEAVAGSRLTLETLESLCRGLAGLSGRKTLFLVSDGFLTGFSSRSETSFDIRRIADAATRAGVAIYSLDTRGLIASPPMASASSLTRVLPSTVGAVDAMRRRSFEVTRDAMHALAADTGGFLVEGTNNLQAGLRELLGDTETYYVLAYEPTNGKRDGKFRKIDVRLPGTSGLKVRTRSGYYAPDDSRQRRVNAAAEATARRAEQRRAELNVALGALAPLRAIPVRLSAEFVSPDGAATNVVVSGRVDVGTLPFVRVAERRQATLRRAGPRRRHDGLPAVGDEPLRRGLRAAAEAGSPLSAHGRARSGPLPGAPRRARGRHGPPGQRVAEGRGARAEGGPPGSQRAVSPEGRRRASAAGRPARHTGPAQRGGPSALRARRGPLRAAVCVQPEARRGRRHRSRGAGPGPESGGGAGHRRAGADGGGRARGAGAPRLPDWPAALRARGLRAAHLRHRPQRSRDCRAHGRVRGRLIT
jgi:VWFA-related protein